MHCAKPPEACNSWDTIPIHWFFCNWLTGPKEKASLNHTIGEATATGGNTRMIHFREGLRGQLWQGRFASHVMNEKKV
jgi:hypothetical protein